MFAAPIFLKESEDKHMDIAVPFNEEDLKEILAKYFGYKVKDIDVEDYNAYEIAEIIKDMII